MNELLKHPDLILLNDFFEGTGHKLRLVGGCVRDMLRGVKPKDIDLCTDATPQDMLGIAETFDLNVAETGLKHGTLTFVINHTPYEITTCRIDTDTDGRHAEVQYTRSFVEDAGRRDLTINAMSMDFDGKLYDYFGGQEDLKNEHIRFVGDAGERIREDYLRILRYFRFAAKLGAKMDFGTLQVIEQNRTGLDQISRERVWLEMAKLFVAHDRIRVLQMMERVGVLKQIGLDDFDYRMIDANCAEAALASFAIGKPMKARDLCNEWKLSREETDKTVWIALASGNCIDMYDVEDWVNAGIDRGWIRSALALRYGVPWVDDTNAQHMYTWAEVYPKVEFPVRGQDLLDIGMKPGKEIGEFLTYMRGAWIRSRYKLDKTSLMENLTQRGS